MSDTAHAHEIVARNTEIVGHRMYGELYTNGDWRPFIAILDAKEDE